MCVCALEETHTVSKKDLGFIFKWTEMLTRSYTKCKGNQKWTKHLWVQAAKTVCNLSISRIGHIHSNKVIISFCPHTKKKFQRPVSLQTSNSGNRVFSVQKSKQICSHFKWGEQKQRFWMSTCFPLWQSTLNKIAAWVCRHQRVGNCKSAACRKRRWQLPSKSTHEEMKGVSPATSTNTDIKMSSQDFQSKYQEVSCAFAFFSVTSNLGS